MAMAIFGYVVVCLIALAFGVFAVRVAYKEIVFDNTVGLVPIVCLLLAITFSVVAYENAPFTVTIHIKSVQ